MNDAQGWHSSTHSETQREVYMGANPTLKPAGEAQYGLWSIDPISKRKLKGTKTRRKTFHELNSDME